jgi:hypothetical protein
LEGKDDEDGGCYYQDASKEVEFLWRSTFDGMELMWFGPCNNEEDKRNNANWRTRYVSWTLGEEDSDLLDPENPLDDLKVSIWL